MRIVELTIENWRNFHGIKLSIPEDSTLVCLVGENGTGKSNILELISAAANRLGISPGIEMSRGDPFSEEHSFSIQIKLSERIEDLLAPDRVQYFSNAGVTWNGKIALVSSRKADGGNSQVLLADGIGDENIRRSLANEIRDALHKNKETNYLSLDADRAYPPLQIHPQHYAEALGRDWEEPQFKRQRAFVPTRTMYDEWVKYFLARETQEATKLQQNMRRAKERKEPYPEFVDCFDSYKVSVQKVLPHLKFVGVDTTHKTLVFDSSGLELRFTSLSGGEREIAFIIGQIERFQLRHGILLIDEPELHLNPDLLRNWVAYLRDTIVTGQIWISTHSLEAVEAAGPDATFVLERTVDTRTVESVTSLASRPVLSVLSAAVGSPAFSLKKLRFVYIEGDRQGREKERFYSLYGDPRFVRIIEGGGCSEVIKKLAAVRELALDADEQIRVGGIIDRDFRTEDQIGDLTSKTPIFALGCHEIENIFLHPDSLHIIATRSNIGTVVGDVVRAAADRFAGLWILGRTITVSALLSESTKQLRQVSGALDWDKLEADLAGNISSIADAAFDRTDQNYSALYDVLTESARAYTQLRQSPDLWKYCMGKEVLRVIPAELGLRSVDVLESNVLKIWGAGEAKTPQELSELKAYIDSIE